MLRSTCSFVSKSRSKILFVWVFRMARTRASVEMLLLVPHPIISSRISRWITGGRGRERLPWWASSPPEPSICQPVSRLMSHTSLLSVLGDCIDLLLDLFFSFAFEKKTWRWGTFLRATRDNDAPFKWNAPTVNTITRTPADTFAAACNWSTRFVADLVIFIKSCISRVWREDSLSAAGDCSDKREGEMERAKYLLIEWGKTSGVAGKASRFQWKSSREVAQEKKCHYDWHWGIISISSGHKYQAVSHHGKGEAMMNTAITLTDKRWCFRGRSFLHHNNYTKAKESGDIMKNRYNEGKR